MRNRAAVRRRTCKPAPELPHHLRSSATACEPPHTDRGRCVPSASRRVLSQAHVVRVLQHLVRKRSSVTAPTPLRCDVLQARSCPDMLESSSSSLLDSDTSPDGVDFPSAPMPLPAAIPVTRIGAAAQRDEGPAAAPDAGSAEAPQPAGMSRTRKAHRAKRQRPSDSARSGGAGSASGGREASRVPLHAALGLAGHLRDSMYQFVPRPTSSNQTASRVRFMPGPWRDHELPVSGLE